MPDKYRSLRSCKRFFFIALFCCCFLLPKAAVHAADPATDQPKIMTRTIPVQPRYTGTPAAGYIVVDTVADPATVSLKGPENKLLSMETVDAQSIKINDRTQTDTQTVSLTLPEGVSPVDPGERFTIKIIIKPKILEEDFHDIPIHGKNPSYPYIIRPNTIDVRVEGHSKLFPAGLSPTDVNAYIDLRGMMPGIYVKPVTINLPDGAVLIEATPKVFTIQVHPTPTNHLRK